MTPLASESFEGQPHRPPSAPVQFDTNGDGEITLGELRQAMQRLLGERLTAREIAEVVQEADVNGDGTVNFEGDAFHSNTPCDFPSRLSLLTCPPVLGWEGGGRAAGLGRVFIAALSAHVISKTSGSLPALFLPLAAAGNTVSRTTILCVLGQDSRPPPLVPLCSLGTFVIGTKCPIRRSYWLVAETLGSDLWGSNSVSY